MAADVGTEPSYAKIDEQLQGVPGRGDGRGRGWGTSGGMSVPSVGSLALRCVQLALNAMPNLLHALADLIVQRGEEEAELFRYGAPSWIFEGHARKRS